MTGPHPTRWELWLSALALALFVAGRCLVPMDETDVFYNLRLGEIVLSTGTVPRTNLFSFVAADTPDPNLAWLFQILLALAHRAGGIPGTVILKTAFVVATFQLLQRVALRRGAPPALAAAVLALAAWAAEPRFVERPHLITFLGLAVLLLALERAEAKRPRLLWALVPLGLLWANGNSCFFLAPAILLLYAGGAAADGLRGDGRRAALAAAAMMPLLFATPSGAGWLGYVRNHFRMPWLRPLQEYRLAEWPTDGPFLFLLVGVALVTVLAPRRRQRQLPGHGAPGARHLVPALALAVLGSRRIRFVAEFALLAGPLVAAGAAPLLAAVGHWARRRRHALAPGSMTGTAPFTLATAAALVIITVIPRVEAARQGAPVVDLGIEKDLVPAEAIAWTEAQGLRDRMYNDLEVGSYLIWEGWPRHGVFQDPRINGYPEWFHAILRRPDLQRADWQALLDRHGVTSALITYPDVNPRAALFDPELWALVRRGEDALVFTRREPGRLALLAAEELPLTFAFDPASGVRASVLDRPPAASPVSRCEWNRRRAMHFRASGDEALALEALTAALVGDEACLTTAARTAAREDAATLALGAGAPGRALAFLAGLSTARARTDRGLALLQLGRATEALEELAQAVRLHPDSAEAAVGRALALHRLHQRADAIAALRAFLRRWPTHTAAAAAREALNDLDGRVDDDVLRAAPHSPL